MNNNLTEGQVLMMKEMEQLLLVAQGRGDIEELEEELTTLLDKYANKYGIDKMHTKEEYDEYIKKYFGEDPKNS